MPAVDDYLETQVLTAAPHRLHLMVVDGAMRFTRQGLAAMREARWEAMGQAFRRARDCVTEMVGGVKPEVWAGTRCELPVAVPVHLPGTLAGGDGPESRADRRPAATAADAPRDVGGTRREAADGERFVRGENSRTASRRPHRAGLEPQPKFSGLTAEARNSKSEIRNKSQIQKPKRRGIRSVSNLEIGISFGFRQSDFEFLLQPTARTPAGSSPPLHPREISVKIGTGLFPHEGLSCVASRCSSFSRCLARSR